MVINLKPIQEAIEQSPDGKARIANKADLSPQTLDKILDGSTDVILNSIDKIAAYLGFEVTVEFRPLNGKKK